MRKRGAREEAGAGGRSDHCVILSILSNSLKAIEDFIEEEASDQICVLQRFI